MIGRTVSHYRIVEEIGAGGMGVVYRARDLRLERDVALKVLPAGALADDASRRRFRREALALSRLNHPAVESVFDFDTHEGLDFLVMELVPGDSLERRLAQGTLPEAEVVHIGIQIAEGLEAAHEQGVIHRDLKPANILVTAQGRVKLADFGIAKLLGPVGRDQTVSTITEMGEMVGTPRYTSPEMLLGAEVDGKADLYALGVVLYELCAGRPPFTASPLAALFAEILHADPPRLGTLSRGVSPGLERIVHRCLERDPARRHGSASELLGKLRALESGAGSQADHTPRPVAQHTARTPRAAVVAAIVLATILLTILAGREGWIRLFPRTDRIQSLAVLPLINLSADPEQEFFADGMTEELITEIAQVASLRVISRTSAMAFKRSTKSLPEIARALRVDAIVEGSVQRQGDRVRVTAQLVRASDDRHLWAKTYERDLRDMLNIQTEIASAITAEVHAVLQPAERSRLARTRTVNAAAHEAYLKGRYQWNRRSAASLERAVALFQQAIALDSAFAPAYAGLANTYLVMPVYTNVPTEESYARAREAARRALALDEGNAEAHAVLAGVLHESEWRHDDAEREYQRAIELNPSDASTRQFHGEFLDKIGRPREAIAELERAHDLDPLSLIVATICGAAYWHDRDYPRAIERLQAVLEMDSTFGRALWHLGSARLLSGDIPGASPLFEKADVLMRGRDPVEARTISAQLLDAYRTGGRDGYWRKALEIRLPRAKAGLVRPQTVAVAYAQLGMKDEAFEWLERAFRERDPEIMWIQALPYYDPIRDDPRFRVMLERLGYVRAAPSRGRIDR